MKNQRLEIWGGVECTLNRVGDVYFDQVKTSGHYERHDDLGLFAKMGLRTLRHPFLWEHLAPAGVRFADWSWADERMMRLRKLGIKPIAGFVHHGSGPLYTNLLDDEFANKLADFAAAFAARYPDVELYTPVNEILTTARFSALYGLWYPHKRDELSMMKVLLNECKATVLAMRMIRKANPNAKLVQTDDLGRAKSTPLLQYQVDYENERRWLGFDVLSGRFLPGHPLWSRTLGIGVSESELMWFAENPCVPDVIGINTYLLSNRYLDEKIEHYPKWSHGGNSFHQYTDVESVRVEGIEPVTVGSLILEAWNRYHVPIAVTEVHVDAGREDQIRWLMEVWRSCESLKCQGVDVRAVTAWGLLGHFDWHCLVTRSEGYYESGVFDLRSSQPRPTALAKVISSLSSEGSCHKDYDWLLETPGWWHRPTRVQYPKMAKLPEPHEAGSFAVEPSRARYVKALLIAGANGTLGKAFAKVCEARGLRYISATRNEMDIGDINSVRKVVSEILPWAVVNAAGYVKVDEAEGDYERCYRDNVAGPENLAKVCAEFNIPLLTFSSDLVFDGLLIEPYVESSLVSPLNVYGRTKSMAEERVLGFHDRSLIVRSSAFFGPWDEYNFVTKSMRVLERGQKLAVISDNKVSPTYVPDLVNTSLNLLFDQEVGIWHLANDGEVTWADFARQAAEIAKLPTDQIVSISVNNMNLPARRPVYSALKSERGRFLPSLEKALSRYFEERRGV